MAIMNTKKQKLRTSSSMEGRDGEHRTVDLPESILLHILSFLDTRSAVKTSLVSRTWINLWRSVDTLRLDFFKSSFFAARVLRRLDSSASHIRHLQYHHAQNFAFDRCPDQKSPIFARVLKFAADRNCRSFELGCVALVCHDIASFLPNVTTLRLDRVVFGKGMGVCNMDVFSNCPNLQDLSLINCVVYSAKKIEISCPKLVKLRIDHTFMCHHLYTRKCKLVVSSPELTSLEIVGYTPFPLTIGSHSLHRVSLSIKLCYRDDPEIEGMMTMLQALRGVKHLELSTLFLQALSNYPELLRKQTFGFHSLKSLNLRAIECKRDFKLPNDVMKFFLADSPSAKVTLPKFSELR